MLTVNDALEVTESEYLTELLFSDLEPDDTIEMPVDESESVEPIGLLGELDDAEPPDSAELLDTPEDDPVFFYSIGFEEESRFGVFIPYIYDSLIEPDLEDKINHTISMVVNDWIDRLNNEDIIEPTAVFIQNDRFLSFSQSAVYLGSRRARRSHNFATIDMETGDRVFLDDLVNMNSDFFDLLWNEDIVTAMGPAPFLDGEPGYHCRLGNFSLYELNLQRSSQREFMHAWETDEWQHFFRPNLYFLEPGNINLVIHDSERLHYLQIPLDRIEDFLKVDKW